MAKIPKQKTPEAVGLTPTPAAEKLGGEAILTFAEEIGGGEPEPTIGRIVHFHRAGQDPVPAIITRVINATTVNLTVMLDLAIPTFAPQVPKAPCGCDLARYWCWPPKA